MTTPATLQAIKERDARAFASTKQYVAEGVIEARADRRHLLSLVERMRPYMKHERQCVRWADGPCHCGLDALLKELST